ncbi:hypothetical protein NKW55_15275 [Gluconobacter kondonii]|uniref:hypothetical protein n=1 Tax=Gluconobacter kondonii TaxID=941463 RepID=UPI00209EB3A5|nr:hypothetical protein [Gluconobacter kondonii]MCP1237925.1 hypothetical protein [Gluconobacter kondonii]
MLPFNHPNVLLASDLNLTRQLFPLAFGLPLPFHPLPALPGQTDRQPGGIEEPLIDVLGW